MIVRYLDYLVTLARERHFTRAAADYNLTQPALSAGIKQLEESLGVLIVERRQRFVGFTAEGERLLAWAQRVLADYGGLTQELSELREGLAGQLRIGAIPVSLPALTLLTAPFGSIHSKTRFQITWQTSIDIQRELDDFSIEVGLTYLDNGVASSVGLCRFVVELRSVHLEQLRGKPRKIAAIGRAITPGVFEGPGCQILDNLMATQPEAEVVVDSDSNTR